MAELGNMSVSSQKKHMECISGSMRFSYNGNRGIGFFFGHPAYWIQDFSQSLKSIPSINSYVFYECNFLREYFLNY